MTETRIGAPERAAARRRRRSVAMLLLSTLALATVALFLVAGASYHSRAETAPPPSLIASVPSPTLPRSPYLMTEGALQMEMTPLSAGSPSASDLARLRGMVRRAVGVEARYGDLGSALADGYRTAPDLLVEAQGQHYFQPQYLEAAARGQFDLLHPPFLVYNRTRGVTRLSGMLYYLPPETPRSRLASIFPPSLAAWHEHVNVCVAGGDSLLTGKAVLPIHDQPTCAARGGSFSERTGWMVHIWAGEPLSRDLFAMDRPSR